MSLAIVVDMNLSPDWIPFLQASGHVAIHWDDLGSRTDKDSIIMAWACDHSHVVLTHDLDFGTLLALTNASDPSVILIRGDDVMPEVIGPTVIAAIQHHESALVAGALCVVDSRLSRVRLLPFRKP